MRFVSVLWLTLLFFSCQTKSDISIKKRQAQQIINKIQHKLLPDQRDGIFEVKTTIVGKQLVIKGKTDKRPIKQAIFSALKNNRIKAVDSLVILPTKLVKNKIAVTRLSVANLRKLPKHASELVTQTLMGMPLRVYEQKNGFYHVQTPEGYYAWVDAAGIVLLNRKDFKSWLQKPKIIITAHCGKTYQEPYHTAQPVSDYVLNDVFALEDLNENFALVSYPDARQAYIGRDNFVPLTQFEVTASHYLAAQDLLHMAKKYLGIPYLWGGTSTKGLDCSGFTKNVFAQANYLLPRDASQQAKIGKEVKLTPDFRNLKPGDLLFFGHKKNNIIKITHVAIHLNNGRIIHATGEVKIESLNKNDADFNPQRYKSLLTARRVFKEINREFSKYYTLDCPILTNQP